MQASSSQGKESYSLMAWKRAKSTPNAGSGNYTAFDAPKSPDNGESTTKENVAGARRVWGTMKSCTSGTIKGAVARFCNIIDIRVKRKTKRIGEKKGGGSLFMVMRNLWPTLTLYGKGFRFRPHGSWKLVLKLQLVPPILPYKAPQLS